MLRFIASLFRRLHGPAGARNRNSSVNTPPRQETDCGVDDELLRVFNLTRGAVLASRVRWAGTSAERRRGLLGRSHINPDEGIYIVPTQWIHMFGMRFAVDVAFLASDGRVLFLHHGLKPNRLSRLVWRAEGALELAAGTLRATNTNVGDMIELS
jgi:uncharacterized membrane protein (UPF0127 family)